MCPPLFDVVLSGSKPFAKTHVETGSVSPVFSGKYLRFGIEHHFVYQATDSTTCLQKYLESIDLAMEDVIVGSPCWNTGEIDLDMRSDINPMFSKRSAMEVVVEYKRGDITHWFEFPEPLESIGLQSHIESIGLNVNDVKIQALKIVDIDISSLA